VVVKNIFICLCLFLTGANLLAQGGFRVRHYLPGSINHGTRDIFEIGNKQYLACGFSSDTSGMGGYLVDRLTMMKLDSAGQIVSVKKYGTKNFTYLNNQFVSRFFYKQGNNVYTACCVRDSNNKQIGVLIKFDLNGDTLWQKIYRDSMDVIPQMVTGSVDGGFLITGFFQDWNGGGSPCMLIKTNAFGNELWRKKINKAGHNVSDGKAIIQDTATGKIVIAGYQYIGNPSSFSTKDHILITDSLGNKLIQRSYYGANDGLLIDLVQTTDKNVVAVGVAYKNQYWGSNQLQCSYILKININGIQTTPPLWSNTNFDSPEIDNSFYCIRELPNGDLLAGGHIDTLSYVQDWFLIRMSRFSANGGHIRSWYYNYKANGPNESNSQVLKSFNLTSDGGWVAGIGQVNFPNPNPLFYVKYDSTGCDSTEVYCLNPVGLQELKVESSKFKVYPNPSSGIFEIASESKLSGTVLVYDLFGRLIISKEVKETQKIQVSLEGFGNGIYLVELRQEELGIIFKEKLIKQL
jgi:hypothetical protein